MGLCKDESCLTKYMDLKSSTKFICKASFDKDKDFHEGGLKPLKGKSVMLADELKKNRFGKVDFKKLKKVSHVFNVISICCV